MTVSCFLNSFLANSCNTEVSLIWSWLKANVFQLTYFRYLNLLLRQCHKSRFTVLLLLMWFGCCFLVACLMLLFDCLGSISLANEVLISMWLPSQIKVINDCGRKLLASFSLVIQYSSDSVLREWAEKSESDQKEINTSSGLNGCIFCAYIGNMNLVLKRPTLPLTIKTTTYYL